MYKHQTNRVGVATLITSLLLLASTTANAYYLDVNLRWDTATYYKNDLMADGVSLKCNAGAGDYACGTADRYTDNYVYVDVSADLGTYFAQVGDMLTWGIGSGGTSSFSFTGNDHTINGAQSPTGALANTIINYDPATRDYATTGYIAGDHIKLGQVSVQNGQTTRATTLAKIDLDIDVWIKADAADPDPTFTRNFGINSTFEFDIFSTENTATPLENFLNDDEICSRAYSIDPATGQPSDIDPATGQVLSDHRACVLATEEGPPETFDVRGLLGSVYLTGFDPVSPGAIVKNFYDDGRVEYIGVPEPGTIFVMALGLSLLGFQLQRNRN